MWALSGCRVRRIALRFSRHSQAHSWLEPLLPTADVALVGHAAAAQQCAAVPAVADNLSSLPHPIGGRIGLSQMSPLSSDSDTSINILVFVVYKCISIVLNAAICLLSCVPIYGSDVGGVKIPTTHY